jgi:DNA repair exonuclease SbcCD ATPase subunit
MAARGSCMWIERLEIEGFRALSGPFAFTPGLNLVAGDNEAGKSTLYDALIRSLYGFAAPERRRHRRRSVRDDRRPWDSRPFGLVAIVRDADSRDYRIEWDFEAHRARLLEGGTDRSGEIQRRGDDVGLGEFLLGIGLDDFRQVCCLDQEALEAVRQSPSLGVALQEAVAQIGGDVAAEDVIERLEAFLREHVGVRVDTLAPTPRGRITALLRERAEVVAALEEEREVREQIADLAESLALTRADYEELTIKIERVRQRLLLSERDELAHKLDEAGRLQARVNDRVEGPTLPTQQVIDGVHAGQIRLEQLGEEIDASEREVSRVAGDTEALERKERELDARLLELESYAAVEDSGRDSVQRMWGELDSLKNAALREPEPVLQPNPELIRYRSERQVLYALQAGDRSRWTLRRVAWTALVVATLGIALLVRKLIRRLRGATPTVGELERRLAEYGAPSLAELDERVADEDRRLAAAQARAEVARSQAAEREQRLAELETELAGALDAAGAAAASTMHARATAYLEACERHAKHIGAALELERVKNELQYVRRPRQELRALQSERERVSREIRELYALASVEGDDLAAAGEALDALLARGAVAARANQEADSAAQALKTLLGAKSATELEEELSELERALAEHVARFGTLATEGGEKSALQRELTELQKEAEDTRDRVTEGQTRMSALEEKIGESAPLEERRAELDAKIERLEQAKQAIGLARQVLREAADELHRQFQPHLRAALIKNLPRITAGRYEDAEIDNELRVHVIAPGVGRQVGVDQLSRATRDQIFLVERLEIARLLAPTKGSAPLLLDDPFAHYDAKRLRFGLELVREAAEERQVIVFSEDEDLPELAEEICGDCKVIELPEPAVRSAWLAPDRRENASRADGSIL